MHDSAESCAASQEMPRYISHKKIWALEIAEIQYDRDYDQKILIFKEAGYAPLRPEFAMFSRYVPVPGDFYVVYADGYKSFSPRKAFLEGYKRIGKIEKPTIAELEKILAEDDSPVRVNPDGSVERVR